MAGSWNHIITRDGKLLNNEDFTVMIENLGDAYEAAEECFGMIWYLAQSLAENHRAAGDFTRPSGRVEREDVLVFIEEAREAYRDGLHAGGVQS
jgi:hypothetical protein